MTDRTIISVRLSGCRPGVGKPRKEEQCSHLMPRSLDHPADGQQIVLNRALCTLVVRACRVVYGDIGTSVLYTFRDIFGPIRMASAAH